MKKNSLFLTPLTLSVALIAFCLMPWLKNSYIARRDSFDIALIIYGLVVALLALHILYAGVSWKRLLLTPTVFFIIYSLFRIRTVDYETYLQTIANGNMAFGLYGFSLLPEIVNTIAYRPERRRFILGGFVAIFISFLFSVLISYIFYPGEFSVKKIDVFPLSHLVAQVILNWSLLFLLRSSSRFSAQPRVIKVLWVGALLLSHLLIYINQSRLLIAIGLALSAYFLVRNFRRRIRSQVLLATVSLLAGVVSLLAPRTIQNFGFTRSEGNYFSPNYEISRQKFIKKNHYAPNMREHLDLMVDTHGRWPTHLKLIEDLKTANERLWGKGVGEARRYLTRNDNIFGEPHSEYIRTYYEMGLCGVLLLFVSLFIGFRRAAPGMERGLFISLFFWLMLENFSWLAIAGPVGFVTFALVNRVRNLKIQNTASP